METKTKAAAPAAKADSHKATKSETEKKPTAKEPAPAKSSKSSEFRSFVTDELKDILWAEKALLKAYPKMSKAATSKKLSEAFTAHIPQTEARIETISQVFETLGSKPHAKKCEAMEGLLLETESIIADTDKGSALRDTGLILAAQKARHYAIATYGTLSALANAMGEAKTAKLLEGLLKEHRQIDSELTAMALENINADAAKE